MSVYSISDDELNRLLRLTDSNGQREHAVLNEIPLSLNISAEQKRSRQPDTELAKALKKAKRNSLQDAFINTWKLCGGDEAFWTPEYKFHPLRKWRFDFANPTLKFAVECNGGQWVKSGHSSGKGLQRDAEKLNTAQAAGWRVYVLTTSMLSKRDAIGNVRKIMQEVQE